MEEKTATRKKHVERAGKGCFLQILGLLCPVVGIVLGPVGIVIGLVCMILLFVRGSQESIKWQCSNCGTALANKKVQECPGCHATLTK